MPRGNQVTRQWRLIQLLERSRCGLTFDELARELDCTSRTVMRDLEHIQAVGFPVAEDRDGKEKRWKFVEGYRSDLPVPLSVSELMALYFTRSLLKPLHGTPFHFALKSVIEKIRALLPREGHGFLDQIEGTVTTRGPAFKDYSRVRGVLEALTTARLEGRRLEIRYYSFSREALTTRRIDPYHLFYHQGGLYIAAYDHLRAEVRIFAVERIRELRQTGDTFRIPDDFDFDTYMQGSFGILRGETSMIRIHFSRHRAKWIAERNWHESQEIQSLPDGDLILSLKVADTAEIKGWILSFGQDAEVLEPASLREQIRVETEALLSRLEVSDALREISAGQLTLPVMDGA
jgi:predicted DNA-binding transcriptional regulator YafY